MKLIYLIPCFILLTTISSIAQKTYDDVYYDRYDSFLGEGEEKVHGWYQGLYSSTDTTFITRIFYPERKQITALKSYLAANHKVKHGLHKIWTDHGILLSEGYYYNNDAIGGWKFYYRNGQLASEGKYENGYRTGTWLMYDADGWLEQKITWSNGVKEGAFTEYDSLGNTINSGLYKEDEIVQQTTPEEEEDFPSLQEMPYLKEFEKIRNPKKRKVKSDRALLQYIYQNITYPPLARENAVEGKAIIRFVVKSDGSIEDVEILSGICEGIEKECLRIVKGFPKWNPGKLNGKPVNVSYNLPIRFKLN